MKQFLLILLLTPFIVFSQQKPKAPAAAKKPATSAATKKPASASAAKPATTAVKKPNPQVVKLTEQA